MPVQTGKPVRLHNKPKKAQDYVVAPEDYVCTGDDWSVIENIMSEPNDKRNLVSNDDSHLKRRHLERLLLPEEFLGDEIIDAYIHCISAKEHLQMRSGGSVFLENACISKMIKEFSSIRDDAPRWVLNRAKTYLENGIFLPVNIEHFHWYLAVINTGQRCIQVLDSLGPGMSRKDLTAMLKGLENVFEYASLQMELNTDKWKDLNISAWPREEYIKSTLQRDWSSCGLWMINFMEYFTGNILYDIPTQKHMTDFRTKLAVILVDSELNDDNIRKIETLEDERQHTDPTECMILDTLLRISKTSNTSGEVRANLAIIYTFHRLSNQQTMI
uniref:Ubiquitin-like protease family profile domain-containing protein n=1 Tax=Triticum urartu TaxID=4572 RepID=A0A8R7K158_TRIUA